jgi:hypothetical protein
MATDEIARRFPLLHRHLGCWAGVHRSVSPAGRLLDEYEARVLCRRDGERYLQTTTRRWPDGREQATEFSGSFREGRLVYEGPDAYGAGVEVDESSILSTWTNPALPGVSWVALITLLADDRRCRTIQQIEGGRLTRLIVIEESRID